MTMKTPPVVTASEWEAARQQLLVKEKDLTRARDALAAVLAVGAQLPTRAHAAAEVVAEALAGAADPGRKQLCEECAHAAEDAAREETEGKAEQQHGARVAGMA